MKYLKIFMLMVWGSSIFLLPGCNQKKNVRNDIEVSSGKDTQLKEEIIDEEGTLFFAVFCNLEGLYGYVDETGKEVISCQYQNAGDFASNGLAPVENDDGLYGYINTRGDVVLEYQYDYADSFASNGLARVRGDNELYGYINANGEEIISCQYEDAFSFQDNGLALVRNKFEELYGCINESGDEVIPCEYLDVEYFNSKGVFLVESEEELWGCFDDQGREVIPCQYVEIKLSDLGCDLYAAKNAEGMWGFLDSSGEIRIPFEYIYASGYDKNGLAICSGVIENEYRGIIINTKADVLATFDLRNPETPSIAELILDVEYGGDDLFVIETTSESGGAMRGCINNQGQWIIPLKHNCVDILQGNVFAVGDITDSGDLSVKIVDDTGEILISEDYVEEYSLLKFEDFETGQIVNKFMQIWDGDTEWPNIYDSNGNLISKKFFSEDNSYKDSVFGNVLPGITVNDKENVEQVLMDDNGNILYQIEGTELGKFMEISP